MIVCAYRLPCMAWLCMCFLKKADPQEDIAAGSKSVSGYPIVSDAV